MYYNYLGIVQFFLHFCIYKSFSAVQYIVKLRSEEIFRIVKLELYIQIYFSFLHLVYFECGRSACFRIKFLPDFLVSTHKSSGD